MKKIISLSLIVVAVLVGGIFVGQTANAQTATQTTRCSTGQTRLNERIAKVNTTKEAYLKTYNELNTKVETLMTSAKANGFETIKLIAAHTAVDSKITDYTTKATAYSDALMATKNLSCGTSDTEFTTSLTAARAALTATRTSSLAVRTAFTAEAIPAMKEYVVWLNDQLLIEEAN